MLFLLLPTPAVVLPRPMVTPRATITQMAAGPGPQSGWGASVAAETWGNAKAAEVAGPRSAAERAAQRRSNPSPEAVPAASQPRTAAERAAQRAARGPSPASPTAVATSTQPRTAAERAAQRAARPAAPTPRVAQPRTAEQWSAQWAAGSAKTTAAQMVPSPSLASYRQNPPSSTNGGVSRIAERSQRVAQKAQKMAETQTSAAGSPLVAAQRAARSKAKGVVVPTGRAATPAPTVAAIVARSSENTEEAARAWLAKLNVPTWGLAAVELSKAAAEASAMMLLAEQCESGDDAACAVLDKEEAAWLAKMGAAPWGAATSAPPAEHGVLTKLDATRWGQVAAALSQAAATADVMNNMTEECDRGCSISCDLVPAVRAGAGKDMPSAQPLEAPQTA